MICRKKTNERASLAYNLLTTYTNSFYRKESGVGQEQRICCHHNFEPEMETDRVDWHQSSQPADRVTGRVEILWPTGQTD